MSFDRADEEDELLYGDSDSNVLLNQMQPPKPPSPPKVQEAKPQEEPATKKINENGETFWVALVRESGSLEVSTARIFNVFKVSVSSPVLVSWCWLNA